MPIGTNNGLNTILMDDIVRSTHKRVGVIGLNVAQSLSAKVQ